MRFVLALCAALCAPILAWAGLLYAVDLDLGPSNRGPGNYTLTGFIETDGTLGTLSPANLLSWSFDFGDSGRRFLVDSNGVSGTASIFVNFGVVLYAIGNDIIAGNGIDSGAIRFINTSPDHEYYLQINPAVNNQINTVTITGYAVHTDSTLNVSWFNVGPPTRLIAEATETPEPSSIAILTLACAAVPLVRRLRTGRRQPLPIPS